MAPKIDQNRCQFGVLGPPGSSWERFGPHLDRLGPDFGPKVPKQRRSHNRTKKKRKNRVQKEERGWGSAAEGWTSGALGKQPIPRKACLNPWENANPAKWRKPWPLGKGNY